MTAGEVVHVLVPEGIHDPLRPSGGNTYDRRLVEELEAAGWSVRLVELAGSWPDDGEAERETLERELGALPDGSVALVDGLVASALGTVVVPACHRLRVVVLMHMPLGLDAAGGLHPEEGALVRAAAAVVTPSAWARSWLLATYGLDPGLVHVARPGVDPVPRVDGTEGGGALLCVGAVTPDKGQAVLVAALSRVADLPWRCTCVGSLTVAPEYADRVRRDARHHHLDERLVLTGALVGDDLASRWAAADVLVLPSRKETYGMVVTEALARGLPVIASDVGGVPEALGAAPGGAQPGLLVPPGDVPPLAEALRLWLSDADRRAALREAARERRTSLASWADTADRVGRVLREVAA